MYSAAPVPARQPANLRWTFRTHAFTANDRGHVRTITLRLFPAAACEVQCKCKKYFATRPGPRTATGVCQEMQTVFHQEHAAYDRSLRQSPAAAAEWAKPREIRRGTRLAESERRVRQTTYPRRTKQGGVRGGMVSTERISRFPRRNKLKISGLTNRRQMRDIWGDRDRFLVGRRRWRPLGSAAGWGNHASGRPPFSRRSGFRADFFANMCIFACGHCSARARSEI